MKNSVSETMFYENQAKAYLHTETDRWDQT